MTTDGVLRWIHLLAAATWTGGLVTLAALVPALRRGGVTRPQLQIMARRFGRVSWTAMIAAVATGFLQAERLELWWEGSLVTKVAVVGAVAALALLHQVTAGRVSPAARGVVQGLVLAGSLGIFAAAVGL